MQHQELVDDIASLTREVVVGTIIVLLSLLGCLYVFYGLQ